VTGLIGGFLKSGFRIIDYFVQNPEQGMIGGGKPASLFLFGSPIVFPGDMEDGAAGNSIYPNCPDIAPTEW
jgi:hypothetical protein